jgi:hypothetical protein
MSKTHGIDPDALYDDEKVAIIEVSIRRNGSMSIAGNINNFDAAILMLEQARDNIKQKQIAAQGKIIIPASDSGVKLDGNGAIIK